MGTLRGRRIELVTEISEIVGYKSGFALTRQEISEHFLEHEDVWKYEYCWDGYDEEIIRVGSDIFEEMIAYLLFRLGNISIPSPTFPGIPLYHRFKNDPRKLKLFESISDLFLEQFPLLSAKAKQEGEPIDLTLFLEEVAYRYKTRESLDIALEFIEQFEVFIHIKPWSVFRRQEWIDTIQLKDLFQSESLETYYGKFFDQRFINYLYRNFESIDRINWRKFEGLTCEFFERAGFYVEIGEGRNDGNIDARVWPKQDDKNLPPTILVQCKREKQKVGKVIVKALWADIVAEGARSGLIVTTSALSSGAEQVRTARAYPVEQANRGMLRCWIEALRSPHTGVFLGE